MKRIAFTLLFVLYILTANAVPSDRYCLVVNTKDGSKQTFLLNSRPFVLFQDDQFVISQAGSDIEFSVTDVTGFSFIENHENGIRQQQDGKISISYNDDRSLLIQGANADTKISVTDMDGKLMQFKVSQFNDNTIAVSLADFKKGVYVISINQSQNFKIVKK